jgi:hypothetical protein
MKSLATHAQVIKEINAFVSELDPSLRLEAFKFLLAEEQKNVPKGSEMVLVDRAQKTDRGVASQERLRSCGVSSAMDMALVLAFWLEEDQKKGTFTSLDLRAAFEDAREPAPANPSDVVAKLDAAGKLMKADKVGKSQSYRLTRTGLEQVEQWMNNPKEPEKE